VACEAKNLARARVGGSWPRFRSCINPRPFVIAHRGANRLAPEKPLGALREAARLGVLAIELDVKLSKDKVPVIRGAVAGAAEPVERLQG